MRKLNLGCGADYRDGWLNVDFNPVVRADLYAQFGEGLPLADDSVDHVLLDNALEHIPRPAFFAFIDDLHRVCRNGATIEVFVPHFSGMWAHKHLAHYTYYGLGSFDIYGEAPAFNQERYGRARFRVQRQELLFFHHNLKQFPWLSRFPINALFNFSPIWQLAMERFQVFGFDEIRYVLEVVK